MLFEDLRLSYEDFDGMHPLMKDLLKNFLDTNYNKWGLTDLFSSRNVKQFVTYMPLGRDMTKVARLSHYHVDGTPWMQLVLNVGTNQFGKIKKNVESQGTTGKDSVEIWLSSKDPLVPHLNLTMKKFKNKDTIDYS